MSESNENIFVRVNRIMSEIGAITKNRNAPAVVGGYAFRGIDDVYFALQPLLVKHGVTLWPEVIESKQVVAQTSNNKPTFHTTVKMKFTLAAVDGSSFAAVAYGEAMDNGDKGYSKAMSSAMKIFAFQAFCIPTQDDAGAHDTETGDEEFSFDQTQQNNVPWGAPLPGNKPAQQQAQQTYPGATGPKPMGFGPRPGIRK